MYVRCDSRDFTRAAQPGRLDAPKEGNRCIGTALFVGFTPGSATAGHLQGGTQPTRPAVTAVTVRRSIRDDLVGCPGNVGSPAANRLSLERVISDPSKG